MKKIILLIIFFMNIIPYITKTGELKILSSSALKAQEAEFPEPPDGFPVLLEGPDAPPVEGTNDPDPGPGPDVNPDEPNPHEGDDPWDDWPEIPWEWPDDDDPYDDDPFNPNMPGTGGTTVDPTYYITVSGDNTQYTTGQTINLTADISERQLRLHSSQMLNPTGIKWNINNSSTCVTQQTCSNLFNTPGTYNVFAYDWRPVIHVSVVVSGPSCATDVQFSEDPTKKYGFDNYGPNQNVPWKSMEERQLDIVKVSIVNPQDYATVFFNPTPAFISLDAVNAPSSMFDLNIEAHDLPLAETKTEAEVQANCNSITGSNIDKLNVVTYKKVIKTVAVRLVNSKSHTGYNGYNSTDIPTNDIVKYLNEKSYNQGLVEWNVTRLPAMSIDFDLNSDGLFDTQTWLNSEMSVIINAAKDDAYDENIFLVDNGSYPSGTGYSDFNQRYAFIHVNLSPNPVNTVAHELGHSTFGLKHTASDPDNIMYNFISPTNSRFRKNQWDIMHP